MLIAKGLRHLVGDHCILTSGPQKDSLPRLCLQRLLLLVLALCLSSRAYADNFLQDGFAYGIVITTSSAK